MTLAVGPLAQQAGGIDRRWLAAEAAWALALATGGLCLGRWAPAILVSTVPAIVGRWVSPLPIVLLPTRTSATRP